MADSRQRLQTLVQQGPIRAPRPLPRGRSVRDKPELESSGSSKNMVSKTTAVVVRRKIYTCTPLWIQHGHVGTDGQGAEWGSVDGNGRRGSLRSKGKTPANPT